MDYLQKIKDKGLKHAWLATRLGVGPTLFSFYMSGERPIPEDRKKKLIQLLS